jgi:membrane-bound serine protease (ClpP class)
LGGFFWLSPVAAAKVMVLRVEGVISPIIAEYLLDNLTGAETEGYQVVIIEIDTPGGLVSTTKEIVTRMLASQVPLVSYVNPGGAGAVSAGSFIALAAHLAAMAPGTNIGAAHPVALGFSADSSQIISQKAANYLSSFMKNIAEQRGRNPVPAERMVRESASFTESEALENNLINLISANLDSLLLQIDGREIQVDTGKVALSIQPVKTDFFPMTWRQRMLQAVSNPTVAYIFMMIGLFGIYFELANPGAVLPGVVGVFCLIVGFYSTEVLSINWAGLLLILFAFILFLLEIKIISHGLLTLGGIVAMFFGSTMLFKAPIPALEISKEVIWTVTISIALFFIFVIGSALRVRRRPVTTGKEALIGAFGTVLTEIRPEQPGQIKIEGEIWEAHSHEMIAPGEGVVVREVDRLRLIVRKKN